LAGTIDLNVATAPTDMPVIHLLLRRLIPMSIQQLLPALILLLLEITTMQYWN